jgi:predicted nucleic acid-binding protein
VIVVDASAVVAALLHAGPARNCLSDQSLHAPHLLDLEVIAVLRRLNLQGTLTPEMAGGYLLAFRSLGVRRFASQGLLERIWELRENLSAYDASYVALAEALGCPLLTADRRLAAAPGPACAIQLVPR